MRAHNSARFVFVTFVVVGYTTSAKADLMDLATKKFGRAENNSELSDVDTFLFESVAEGRAVEFPQPTDVLVNRLEWLLRDHEASKYLGGNGLRIRNAIFIAPQVTGSGWQPRLTFLQVRHPIQFKNCEFESELDLSSSSLRALIFDHCVIRRIDLSSCEVTNGIELTGCSVAEELLASFVTCGHLSITNSTFTRTGVGKREPVVTCRSISVQHELNLSRSVFHDEVLFMACDVGSHIRCQESVFHRDVAFDQANIGESLVAKGCVVHNGMLSCPMANIDGNIDLHNATLGQKKQLAKSINAGVRAPQVLYCGGAAVKGSLHMKNGFTAHGEVNLSDMVVENSIELFAGEVIHQAGNPNPGVRIFAMNLESAQAKTFAFDVRMLPKFQSNFNLNGFVYSRLPEENTDIEGGDCASLIERAFRPKFTPQPYKQLADVLEHSGFEGRASEIREQMQIDMNASDWPDKPGWLWRRSGRIIGYGHDALRAIYYALAEFVVGLFVFGFAWHQKKIVAQSNPEFGAEPKFNLPVYSLDTFVPLIDLQQNKYFMPKSGLFRGFLWWHIGAGWMLSTLLLAGLTGLIK